MSTRSTPEARAQNALLRFLRSGSAAAKAFVATLPETLSSTLPASTSLSFEENVALPYGGFVDILVRGGNTVVAVELKIDHRENPFQYSSYRRALQAQGFDASVVGIVRRFRANRGRELLNFAALSTLSDHRVTWAELLVDLEKKRAPKPALLELRRSIQAIDPTLLHVEPRPMLAPPRREIDRVDTDDVEMGAFLADWIDTLPPGFTSYLDQAGNSPPLVRFGKESWANRFGDGYGERMFMMVDIPRRSKLIPETYFHFGVSLWDKSKSKAARVPRPSTVQTTADRLYRCGFHFQRNIPSKYPPVAWLPPFSVASSGFFYGNAFDEQHFTLTKTAANRMGWQACIELLSRRAEELINLFDGTA